MLILLFATGVFSLVTVLFLYSFFTWRSLTNSIDTDVEFGLNLGKILTVPGKTPLLSKISNVI